MAKVIQVIEVTVQAGKGTEADPVRYMTEYRDFQGNVLAWHDPFLEPRRHDDSPNAEPTQ